MNSKEKQKKENSKGKTEKKKRPCYFVFDFVKITGAIPMFLWFRPKFIYENENAKKKIKGGALVIANHRSTWDAIIMHCAVWYRRLHLVAMQELFDLSKLANWFFHKILCIPINRKNVHIGAFKDIIARLKEGKAVGVFPEGHIHEGDENGVDFFKSGVVLMAMKGDVPIIPMAFVPRKKWWQRQVVVIGEAINIDKTNMSLEDINNVSNKLSEKEEDLFKIYEERRKK